jgi:Cu(I)/Ag(I) efflux system membrane fusion protein
MNINRTAVAVVVVLAVAAGYGLYRLGVDRGTQTSAASVAATVTPMPVTSPAAGGGEAAAGRKVLYWHDPMVPGQKFDKPGKSPFMDMDLVPVYADDGGDQGSVAISARMQQNLGVRTAEVTRHALAPTVEAVGTVAYNERDVAVVQARSNGFVERLFVRAALDPVHAGQPLAELYVPDWVAAQEEYLSVVRMASAGALVDGARQRMRLAGMSDVQIQAVAASGKVQARFTVTAPIGGVVAELAAREGMTVAAGAPLFRINGLSTVWVNAEVPESLAAQVRPGSAVEARTPALGGTTFKGKVTAILPEVNPATRTLKMRVELANPAGALVPGMFATVMLKPAARSEMLQVPSEAVITTGKRNVVVVALGEGRFAPVDVEIGMESNGQTEIRKGLEAGQQVVVSGQFLIDSEASLKGVTARMGAAPAAVPPAAAVAPSAAPMAHDHSKMEKAAP